MRGEATATYSERRAAAWRGWGMAARWLVFFAVAAGQQWYAGAYGSEAVGDDEPAHLMTGLMVRDYAAALATGSAPGPMEYARNYYLHYPKVALGHWPPVFYVLQAAWTAVFPAGREWMLGMMALAAGLMATALYELLRERFGTVSAWCGGVTVLTLPGFAWMGSLIMTEVLQAGLILAAGVALAKYLETERVGAAVRFGAWSAASLLTKGSGLVLAPVPVLAAGLMGRWGAMKRVGFWIPAAMVLLIAGPWYAWVPGAQHERALPMGGPGLVVDRLAVPPWIWRQELGWAVALWAVIGLGWLVWSGRRGRLSGLDAVSVALVVSGSIFPLLIAVWEKRHFVEVAPWFVWLALAGWHGVLGKVSRGRRDWALGVGTAGLLVWNVAQLPAQKELGYRQLAEVIVSGTSGPAEAMLISASGLGEGALIVSVAQREARPRRYVLRATKVLAEVSWLGRDFRERFGSVEALDGFLKSLPLDLVIVDRKNPAPFPYQARLEEALREHPETWERWRRPEFEKQFAIYRRVGAERLGAAELRRRLAELGVAPGVGGGR